MWHRFPVVLTLFTAGSLGGLGYLALSPQAASAPLSLGIESTQIPSQVESAEIQLDDVATTYVQRNQKRGSGRRGMRG